jgi:GT2 family glycosyltransferase
MGRADIAVVVIGRNEGVRLEHCLRSLGGQHAIYVDSASGDGSPDRARATGAEVIELDPSQGLSAARGRNAGLERLIGDPALAYIQVIDGDCELDPDWLEAGAAALDADAGLGAVFGQLREITPQASIYNWMCDVEWAVEPGPARLFGGDALLRAETVRQVGFYRGTMIAGEDPEYAIRLRAAGWRIAALAAPMALHEAGIVRFGQWWRRTVRAGHAFAELVHLHPRSPLHDFGRSRFRILFWAGAVPLAFFAGLILSMATDWRWIGLALAASLLVIVQWLRVGLREARRHPMSKALAFSFFLALGKYAEMIGLIRFHLDRWRGRRPQLIEYKTL